MLDANANANANANAEAAPAAPAASPLSCRHLSVGYGTRQVLGGVSLDLSPAQWHAVVGPNGCGKSTLLRALAGLHPVRSGTIELHGRDISGWSRRERARRLAWLAQSSGATDLTAADVVGLGRLAHDGWLAARTVDHDAAVRRALLATGSLEWAQRRLSSLSGGECQRIHLARALAAEASVLLLDEPTTHLDPPHQEDVVRLLRDQAHGGDVCVVSAIHDLSLALAADLLIVLGRCGLIGHGTVADALKGDWLSAAFETPIDIVDYKGTPLWRPALATR
jgi:iron complex transport system ATP-binding protein